MHRSVLVFLPVTLLVALPEDAQSSAAEVDTSKWQCKWCPTTETNVKTDANVGLGYVTNDSYKFGDYSGLDEKGAYVLADVDVAGRGKGSGYYNLHATDLGLDSRHIDAKGGLQGTLQLEASYDQLPKLIDDTGRTPYSGESEQRLPSGWTPAADTTGMATQLANSLRAVNLSTERRTGAVGATYFQSDALSYDIRYQHETKQGKRSAGLGFASFRSAILAIPVDYETDVAKLGINYRGHRWQAAVNYELSAFNNKNDFVRWDNAFTAPANTPGQAALEPDNSMQQLSVNGAYKISNSVSLAALLSFGQMRQDQQYLPFTVNRALTLPTLPRNSLGGKINTTAANVNLHAGITEKLDLQFQYNQREQDNQTPRATYDYIRADTSAGTARANLPYSFRQRQLQGKAQLRLNQRQQLRAGTDYEIYDRTYQEVDTTNEYRVWGLYKAMLARWQLQFHLDYADRNGDAYETVQDIVPPQNSLMRKYNMADRVRNKAGLSLSYSPLHTLDLGFNASVAKDDYQNSTVGLQDSNETDFSLDVRYLIAESLTLSALYSLSNIDSTQAGQNWQAKNEDRLDVFDAGITYALMTDKLDVGLDYTYAKSNGKITVANSSFPELTTKRHTFKIYGDYTLGKRSYLNVAYLFEKYDEENWSKDGVTVNSIDNVLTLGEVSPSYDIGYFTVGYRHVF